MADAPIDPLDALRAIQKTPPLDWQVPIVEIKTGRPSPQFTRLWQLVFRGIDSAVQAIIGAVQLALDAAAAAVVAQEAAEAAAQEAAEATETAEEAQDTADQAILDAAAANTNANTRLPKIGSSTDNAIARWDGTAGAAVQNSTVVVSDTGAVTGVTTLTVTDDAYDAGWNGDLTVPTKNALYDKIETLATELAIEDEGSPVANATTLNFIGDTVEATDAGGGTVNVTITVPPTPPAAIYAPLVNGDLPGPVLLANSDGACIMVEIT